VQKNKINVLYLGKADNKALSFLAETENVFYLGPNGDIEKKFLMMNKIDFIVSYGYRKIIKKEIINKFKERIINLHMSYLPWNRGAYPNAWSFLDNTPKGVTIHFIDSGIDTGAILVQKLVNFNNLSEHTFSTTYERLSLEIEDIFIENWQDIKYQNICAQSQDLLEEPGSHHTIKESLEKFKEISLDCEKWEQKVVSFINNPRKDNDIINDIQSIREQNNTHWMDVVRLAFRESPIEARDIFKKIKFCDAEVNKLLKELAQNDKNRNDI
tara:strand:- start:124 stop:933 length:810 start_codon:yes stop_codon:yes gene_type:complete